MASVRDIPPGAPSGRAGWLLPGIIQQGKKASSHRLIARIEPGLVLIAQKIHVRARTSGLETSGPFWICGLVRLFRGHIRYRCGECLVEPPGRWFGMFLPPYSVVDVQLESCRALTLGFALSGRMPEGLPPQPVLFRPSTNRLPAGRNEIVTLLRGAHRFIAVSREQNANESARSLKIAIDRSYASPHALGTITRSLGLTPSSASRRFRQAYGLPPIRYRQSLRVLDAMLRLGEGQPICDVFQDVGFQDLSRFYSQFRRIACAPPGRYRFPPEKNAKT